MKAIVRAKYGPPDVRQLAEAEKPILKNDEAGEVASGTI
jgi:hypothetical protein